jgi:hypothetical protein
MQSAEDVISETFGQPMKNEVMITSLRQVADVIFRSLKRRSQ